RGCGETFQGCHSESFAVILSPFAVILSAAKDLALPLRVNFAKDLALSAQDKLREESRSVYFQRMRDSPFAEFALRGFPKGSGLPAAPQNDSPEGFFGGP